MTPRSYIFSISFVLIFGILHVQPMFIEYSVKKEKTCAKANKPACSKTNLLKEEPAEKEKNCAMQGCNPFVPCAIGICCYLVETTFVFNTASIDSRQERFLFDDNRVLHQLSECWQPPEFPC